MKIISIIIIQIIIPSVNKYENFFHFKKKKLHSLRFHYSTVSYGNSSSQSLQPLLIINTVIVFSTFHLLHGLPHIADVEPLCYHPEMQSAHT